MSLDIDRPNTVEHDAHDEAMKHVSDIKMNITKLLFDTETTLIRDVHDVIQFFKILIDFQTKHQRSPNQDIIRQAVSDIGGTVSTGTPRLVAEGLY